MSADNAVEKFAQSAFDWATNFKKDALGKTMSPSVAVEHVLVERGVEHLEPLLERVNKSRDKEVTLLEYLLRLDEDGATELINSWSSIFVGVVAKNIDLTPGKGWSTENVLKEINFQTGRTLFPRLSMEDIESHKPESAPLEKMTDEFQTDHITAVLTNRSVPRGRLGYFFDSVDNLAELQPIHAILINYDHLFTPAVVEAGHFFEKCMLRLRQVAEKENLERDKTTS